MLFFIKNNFIVFLKFFYTCTPLAVALLLSGNHLSGRHKNKNMQNRKQYT